MGWNSLASECAQIDGPAVLKPVLTWGKQALTVLKDVQQCNAVRPLRGHLMHNSSRNRTLPSHRLKGPPLYPSKHSKLFSTDT